jgi:hypothetical protein
MACKELMCGKHSPGIQNWQGWYCKDHVESAVYALCEHGFAIEKSFCCPQCPKDIKEYGEIRQKVLLIKKEVEIELHALSGPGDD